MRANEREMKMREMRNRKKGRESGVRKLIPNRE